jgi:hypothetical protein
VLAIQVPLEPADLALAVGGLGAEGLLERSTVADHGNLGRPNIQADKLAARLIAMEWHPIKDKLGTEGPPSPDAGPRDPATQQPAGRNMQRPPLVARISLIESEWQHESLAPLQPGTPIARPTDSQRSGQVLCLKRMEPARDALEPGPTALSDHPEVDRLVGASAEDLGFLREYQLAQP